MAADTNPVVVESGNHLLRAWRRTRALLSRTDIDQIPSHVARQIEEQGRLNEILTGWVQAALVVTFTLLYVFSRKTAPLDAAIHPVQWALGIYAIFTSWRLYLAYCNRLTHALLMVSIVADMTLLMTTIWGFHIEYGQPAAFYLKAPTLLYVFIFIALRVLSAAPGYVLFAGLCAAAGRQLHRELGRWRQGGDQRNFHVPRLLP